MTTKQIFLSAGSGVKGIGLTNEIHTTEALLPRPASPTFTRSFFWQDLALWRTVLSQGGRGYTQVLCGGQEKNGQILVECAALF